MINTTCNHNCARAGGCNCTLSLSFVRFALLHFQWNVFIIIRVSFLFAGKSTSNSKEIICPDDKYKEEGDIWNVEAQTAFLGPNLWDKTLPYDADLKVTQVSIISSLRSGCVYRTHRTPYTLHSLYNTRYSKETEIPRNTHRNTHRTHTKIHTHKHKTNPLIWCF